MKIKKFENLEVMRALRQTGKLSFKGFKYIQDLDECDAEMMAEVGGKNASLGELLKAGFNAPPGFAITTKAYKRFVQEFNLGEKIRNILSSKNPQKAASEIRELIESHSLPQDIKEEIERAYESLVPYLGENPKFAVRSSGTSEDLPSASFAGQFDSFLGLKNRESILEAVKKCWTSLFTERAITYRNSKNVSYENSSMSVGVQKLIDAKSAGVIFTLDPVTGNRASIVINASWGLGESVVKGRANIDYFVVNKITLDVVRKDISIKESQYVANKGGVKECKVPSELKHMACLTDEEVKELASQAKLIEKHYQRPQDIEFAVDKELNFPKNIFITQSRPETKWSFQKKPLMQPKGHIAEHLASWFRGKAV